MKIGFVEQCFEKLAVEYLITICRNAGADVQLFLDPTLFGDAFYENQPLKRIFDYSDTLAARIAASDVDVLAFSVVSDDYLWASRLAAKVKKLREVVTIFGGVHPTAVPEYVASDPAVDFVCKGEGEEVIVELIDALGRGRMPTNVPNLCFRDGNRLINNPLRNLERDLDSAPFPDKDLFYAQMPLMRNFYMTITSRYCPFRCTFCYNSTYHDLYSGKGKYLRQRSPENVIEELKQALKYDYKFVMFNDDILGFNRRWVREFAPLYGREIGKPFFCYCHPQYSDKETISLLADAGCVTANMGIQSIDPEVRSRIFDRWETQDDIRNAIQNITRHKIYLNTGHIIGFPGDSEEIEEVAGKFYAEARPDVIGCYWLRLYPGTKITNMVIENGQLSPEEIDQINRGEGKSFWLGGSSKHQQEIKPFSILFNSLPLLPSSLLRFFLKKKRYRILRKAPFLVVMLTTRIALAMANFKDLYGRWGLYLIVARLRLYILQHLEDITRRLGIRHGSDRIWHKAGERPSLAARKQEPAPGIPEPSETKEDDHNPIGVGLPLHLFSAPAGKDLEKSPVGVHNNLSPSLADSGTADGPPVVVREGVKASPKSDNDVGNQSETGTKRRAQDLPIKVVAGAHLSEVLVQIEGRNRG